MKTGSRLSDGRLSGVNPLIVLAPGDVTIQGQTDAGMKLKPTHTNELALERSTMPLDQYEQEVADMIAECLRSSEVAEPVGRFIYHTCGRYGVNHHSIARHLRSRRKS